MAILAACEHLRDRFLLSLLAGPAPGQAGAAVILGHVDSATGISVFYYLRQASSRS